MSSAPTSNSDTGTPAAAEPSSGEAPSAAPAGAEEATPGAVPVEPPAAVTAGEEAPRPATPAGHDVSHESSSTAVAEEGMTAAGGEVPPASPPGGGEAPPGSPPPKKPHHDPEEFRMTVGEHLEELRRRLFYGVLGFFVAFVICMIIGEEVVRVFCKPLVIALSRNHLPPQIYVTEAAESFMTYIKISMISAATLAGPWIVYQIWQFVAAGLYPQERKYVTRYLPLSIVLLVTGMLFLYFYVLPLMLEFFIKFNLGSAFNVGDVLNLTPTPDPGRVTIPILTNDPANPALGEMWMNAKTGFVKIHIAAGMNRVLAVGSESLVTPIITLASYIDMVVEMLLAFGLSFQLPLVVLALNKIGILSIAALKAWRRVVYFSLTVISAFVVPDVATGMVALLVPLILLYELGILLAGWGKPKEPEADTPTT